MIWLLICLVTKELNLKVTEFFIRGEKSNFSCFYHSTYLDVLRNIRLTSTHYFVMKTPNKRELQQIPLNCLSDIAFQDFMNLYKKCTGKPHYFLVIDTTLASDNSSRFRKNLLERI